jgi:hypothetical protein
MSGPRTAAALLALAPFASAAQTGGSAAAEHEGWRFSLTPYYWAVDFDGSLTFDDETIEGDGGGDGFPDEYALSGFLGHFEARKNAWAFAFSPVIVNIETDAEDSTSNETELELSGAILEGFAAYEFAPRWSVLGGVRYYDLETSADLALGGGIDSSRDWIDPIVGVRYESSFADRWWLHGRADAGGFGVGSDFAWNAVLAVGYDMSDWARLQLGYRALDFDFADGSGSDRVDYDVLLCGPLLGVTFAF